MQTDVALTPKTCFIRILLIILILVAVSYYFMRYRSLLPPSIVFLQTRPMLTTTTTMTTTTTNTTMLGNKKDLFRANFIRCIVYMRRSLGRLGNQMFIVASAYGLARLHSCHLYLPPEITNELKPIFVFDFRPFVLSTTEFNSVINNKSRPVNRTAKYVVCQYIIELTRPNAITRGEVFELHGYWQSYLHFIKYANELRENIFIGTQPVLERVSKFFVGIYKEKFHFTPNFSTINHQTFKQELTLTNQTTWVGIHVRRTDFRGLDYLSSDEYLFSAVRYFTDQYPDAHFIIASDDKIYCLNLFKNHSNVFITLQPFTIEDDLIALSLCEHSVVTGGTFGWWAAFLANGQVIHDRIYPSGCSKREQYYPPWFLIDGNVRAYRNSNYTLR